MKTPLNVTQTATRPPPSATAAPQGHGSVGREHDHAAPGQVGAVPGADQHAVEDEHDAGDRLPEGGDQQHRDEGVLNGGVAGEQVPEERAAAAASRSPVTIPPTRPHRTIRWVTSRVPSTSPAPKERPAIACAAIAIASSEKARDVEIVSASWWVARSTAWSRARPRRRS